MFRRQLASDAPLIPCVVTGLIGPRSRRRNTARSLIVRHHRKSKRLRPKDVTHSNASCSRDEQRSVSGVDGTTLPVERLEERTPCSHLSKDPAMKVFAALFAAALAFAATSSADAKGCIKGAIVGGVAGHYAGHHGTLGAAAGCLYGRHRAKEQERQQTQGAPRDAQGRM